MMKWVVLIVLLCAFSVQAQVPDWTHRYNGPDNQPERGYDIAVDDAGNVYVCGFGWRSGTYEDYLTIKYDSEGDTAWVRYYDGGQQFYDYGHAIAVDDAGNVFVTGASMESGNQFDIATIKYNSAGIVQWIHRYDGPTGDDDEGYDIALDDSGYIYVTGYSRGAATYPDYITIKYYSYGDTVWTARYNGPFGGIDIANALALDDSGNVYVTGSGNSPTYDYDCYTVKYNAAGDSQWVVAYDGPASSADDKAADIAIGGGFIYITGSSEGEGTALDYITVKYSPGGDTLWEMRYDGPGNDFDSASAIVADSMGNVYVTGQSEGSATLRDYATIKYNFSGNIDWVTRYDGPDSDDDEAFDIILDLLGNVYVVGRSYATGAGTPEYDYLIVKHDPAGDTMWTYRYDGTGSAQDRPYAIATNDVGDICITGSSTGNVGYDDVVTMKYGVTGIMEDAGSTIHDTGYNLTVSPNPFSNQTNIRFTIQDPRSTIENLEMRIFDISGRLVKSFTPESYIMDHVSIISWNGTDDSAKGLPNGVYLVRLEVDDHRETEKILLIRW
jgi:hypothetical protein